MAKRKRFRSIPPKHKAKPLHSKPAILDVFTAAELERRINLKDQILKYHWDYYQALAFQRSQIIDEIKQSLLEASQKTFTFEKWQRAVPYKYALKPFSTAGSLTDPGGRFNIGDITPSQFPPFPALYLAEEKSTAYQELLCQKIEPGKESDAANFALTDPSSNVNISVSGSLDSVLSLKEPEKLQPFVDLIKNFTLSAQLIKTATKAGEREPELIRTVPKLIECLLMPNWRLSPMQLDVPAPSQIFGQLACEARIEGILYPSKFTDKDCLAVFPQNFEESSFIQLDDETPAEIKIRRLDSTTWQEIQKL